MKIQFRAMFFLSAFLFSHPLLAQDEGEKIFKSVCVACHTINQGRLVGPDLANAHLRHSEEWLLKFIRSSQTVVKSGDPVASALFEEYNKIPMPDNPFTENQIRQVIAYIAANSPGGPGAVAPGGNSPGVAAAQINEGNSANGRELFTGILRLADGGPSCISCHHVKNDQVLTGGVFAKDLTEAFTRLKGIGIQSILGSPPFPAMRQAYSGKSLRPAEIDDLTAFLKNVDEIKATQQGHNYGFILLFSGFLGAVVILLLFAGLKIRTKRGSVNQKIYFRQLKSF